MAGEKGVGQSGWRGRELCVLLSEDRKTLVLAQLRRFRLNRVSPRNREGTIGPDRVMEMQLSMFSFAHHT